MTKDPVYVMNIESDAIPIVVLGFLNSIIAAEDMTISVILNSPD